MGKLGLRAKLAIGFSVLLAMLMVLGGSAYTAIRKVTSATEEANLSLNKKELATLLEVGVRKQIQSANDNVFNGDGLIGQVREGSARGSANPGRTGQDVIPLRR